MKKKVRGMFCVALTLIFVVSTVLSGCKSRGTGGGTGTYVLKVGHVCSTDHPYQLGLEKLSELLEEKSDGRLKLEVYPASQLGNESDLVEGLQLGTVDMALTATAPLVNFSDSLTVLDFPYLFESKEHAFNVLDGEIGAQMFEELEASAGIIGLAYFDNGYMFIHNSEKSLYTPDDLEGLKIRTMENQLHIECINAAGGTATPMAFSEVYTSLQNGTIQGSVNSLAAMYYNGIYEVGKYLSYTNHIYATAPLMISSKAYNNLPEDLQEILRECSAEARDFEREEVEKSEAELEEVMTKEGCVFNEVDTRVWKEAIYDDVYEKFVPSLIEAELIEQIEALK